MKRWLLTGMFILALCACVSSAQAAVTSGGIEYVWYVGEAGLYISADQGGSYAVLPELETVRKRTGLSYAITVTPRTDGGLSVKGRDTWSTEYTWFQDYSAQELSAALKHTVPTPVEVYATNGKVTVGSRYVMDMGNDDLTQPGTAGKNLLTGAYAGNRIVYSSDGVTWFPAEEGELGWRGSIWWDGKVFRSSDGGISADGIHWIRGEEEVDDPTFSLACELGPYRFEYAENAAGKYGVYLMDHTSLETGVLLPHMGEAAQAKGIGIGKLRAWYGPNDTVILAAYDVYMKERFMVSIDYPISSLDWCLENLRTQFRYLSTQVDKWGDNEHIGLAIVERGTERELLRYGDGSFQWAEPPFCRVQRLYPYNGKTFVVRADGKLYASEDGLSWQCLEGKGLGEKWDWREYSFVWTGDRYISCRRTVEYHSGRGGTWGKEYDPACTQVRFLDENFQVFASYDFGRQVEAVGYLDGVCYARVNDLPGVAINDYAAIQSTLYRSEDGRTWTPMPSYYTVDREDLLLSRKGSTSPLYHPTGDPNKPHRSIARLDRWRFVLGEQVDRAWSVELPELRSYHVYLMGDVATDWVELPHLGEAIKDWGIQAWELTAEYNPDGTVEVKVTDKNDPAKVVSISYPTSSLDWVKENLMAVAGRDLPHSWTGERWVWPVESNPGVADLTLMELANGENELICRTPATGGHWCYFDSVPWGNEIELLEFSGKDFMVLDKADGRLYLSSDGMNWNEAAGEWYREKQEAHEYRWFEDQRVGRPIGYSDEEIPNTVGCYESQYAMKWTGDKYMAVCFWRPPSYAVYTKVVWGIPNDPDMAKVLYLDEELNLIGSHDFGYMMTEVGYQDGRYFAFTDGHVYQSNFNTGGPECLFTSVDGKNWTESDLLQVQESLVLLQ